MTPHTYTSRLTFASVGCLALAIAMATLTPAACRTPTYVTLKIDTDVPCADLQGTSVTVGRLGELETRAPLTTVTTCSADGTVGSLVVTPSGGDTDEFAVRVVAGLKRNVDECKAPVYGEGCIVARRALRFVENTSLTLPITLRAACSGRACGTDQTCVKGTCVDARIADSSTCSGSGCGEEVLSKAAPPSGRDAGPIVGCGGLSLDFNPSNIDPGALVFPKGGVVSIDVASCVVDGATGYFGCLGSSLRGDLYEYKRVSTPVGDIAVFTMCALRVQPSASLEVRGNLPIALVALGTVDLFGSISALSGVDQTYGGGATSVANMKGGGVGGGNAGPMNTGGGGGGFCGRGGNGGQLGAPGPAGGAPYGTPDLIPLFAGSAGAAAASGGSGGGGAIQIVAGKSATIGVASRIHMSGGGGDTSFFLAGGGGSGGAILIEAETVAIAGILAANGGGGAGGDSTGEPRPAEASDQPASGGVPGTNNAGGQGGAGAIIDGAKGQRLVDSGAYSGGGGGGGVGRIRINSRTPPSITGIVSPSLSTPCATLGALR